MDYLHVQADNPWYNYNITQRLVLLYNLEKQDVVNITANDNASPLLIACQNGHRNCVQMLLQNGADPLLKVELDGEDNTMDYLQYAVKFGHHGYIFYSNIGNLSPFMPNETSQFYRLDSPFPLKLFILYHIYSIF